MSFRQMFSLLAFASGIFLTLVPGMDAQSGNSNYIIDTLADITQPLVNQLTRIGELITPLTDMLGPVGKYLPALLNTVGRLAGQLKAYVLNYVKDVPAEILSPPQNRKDSLKYFLYTRDNPTNACLIEPTPEEYDNCFFNPSYETKMIVPGFNSSSPPGGLFRQMKDAFLQKGSYNVIIVDYRKYSYPPYTLAVAQTYPVGEKIAEMIKFLVDYAGANIADFHLIGHSLGTLVSGNVGKNIANLGRITGMDPGEPLMDFPDQLNQLSYRDAVFVDVIHTSYFFSGQGLGLSQPIGSMDYYVNGGVHQPQCEIDGSFEDRDGKQHKITDFFELALCNHVIVVSYFIESINKCEFSAVQCDSYEDYKQGKCSEESNPTSLMGLPAKKNPDLPPQTKFFLDVNPNPPYCKQ